ncbi:MAG: RagB/SusD family nutrient uptake outer membrane protein [Bacteroidaceae bacterium]|nr:RagB/SusD family nutrient uptake outer membrane protein [Bacteroidaceae bacterium]
MKINKKFLSAGLLALLATSCTNLDVDVESQYTEYPDTELAIEAKMSDLYFQLSGAFGRRYFELMECASDEFTGVSFGGDYYDNGFAINPSYHASTASDATVDWYGDVTSGITNANKIILSLGGEDKPTAASARFMRAYFTYILMDLWGDSPIMDHVVSDDEVIERTSRPEVAKWIESEIKASLPNLTEAVNANTYGKPTKWVAYGLLARLYTNWPVFACADVSTYDATNTANPKADDCIAACDSIIKSGLFNLGSMAYRFKFNHDNGPKVEDFIYAIPYDTYKRGGNNHARAFTWKDLKSCDISYYGYKINNSFGGYMTMTPEYVSIFNLPGDERNKCILGLENDTVFTYDPETLLPTREKTNYKGQPIVLSRDITVSDYMKLDVGKNYNGYCQGLRPIKFYVNNTEYENSRNASNDFPLIRYADILLMKAEALVRSNKTGAKELFNQIRSYVKAPTITSEPTLNEIYDERGREFMGECLRRDDMIRFGHYEDEFFPQYKTGNFAQYANFDKRHRIFPIHLDILNTNSTWVQNSGY